MSGWGASDTGSPRPMGPRRPNGAAASPAVGGNAGAPLGSVGNGGGDPIKDTFVQYQQQVALYGALGRGLGTHQDNQELRSQLKAQESVVQEVGQKLESQLLAQVKGTDGMSKAEKDRIRAENKKLSKDFQAVKQKFGEGVRQTAARIRDVDSGRGKQPPGFGAGGGQAGSGWDDSSPSGLQFQLQQEAIDERILQEREEEIMKINQSVVKVNEIFKDLADIVNKQQEDIDTIATNVEQSHEAAKKGLEQVEKAAKYQPGCSIC